MTLDAPLDPCTIVRWQHGEWVLVEDTLPELCGLTTPGMLYVEQLSSLAILRADSGEPDVHVVLGHLWEGLEERPTLGEVRCELENFDGESPAVKRFVYVDAPEFTAENLVALEAFVRAHPEIAKRRASTSAALFGLGPGAQHGDMWFMPETWDDEEARGHLATWKATPAGTPSDVGLTFDVEFKPDGTLLCWFDAERQKPRSGLPRFAHRLSLPLTPEDWKGLGDFVARALPTPAVPAEVKPKPVVAIEATQTPQARFKRFVDEVQAQAARIAELSALVSFSAGADWLKAFERGRSLDGALREAKLHLSGEKIAFGFEVTSSFEDAPQTFLEHVRRVHANRVLQRLLPAGVPATVYQRGTTWRVGGDVTLTAVLHSTGTRWVYASRSETCPYNTFAAFEAAAKSKLEQAAAEAVLTEAAAASAATAAATVVSGGGEPFRVSHEPAEPAPFDRFVRCFGSHAGRVHELSALIYGSLAGPDTFELHAYAHPGSGLEEVENRLLLTVRRGPGGDIRMGDPEFCWHDPDAAAIECVRRARHRHAQLLFETLLPWGTTREHFEGATRSSVESVHGGNARLKANFDEARTYWSVRNPQGVWEKEFVSDFLALVRPLPQSSNNGGALPQESDSMVDAAKATEEFLLTFMAEVRPHLAEPLLAKALTFVLYTPEGGLPEITAHVRLRLGPKRILQKHLATVARAEDGQAIRWAIPRSEGPPTSVTTTFTSQVASRLLACELRREVSRAVLQAFFPGVEITDEAHVLTCRHAGLTVTVAYREPNYTASVWWHVIRDGAVGGRTYPSFEAFLGGPDLSALLSMREELLARGQGAAGPVVEDEELAHLAAEQLQLAATYDRRRLLLASLPIGLQMRIAERGGGPAHPQASLLTRAVDLINELLDKAAAAGWTPADLRKDVEFHDHDPTVGYYAASRLPFWSAQDGLLSVFSAGGSRLAGEDSWSGEPVHVDVLFAELSFVRRVRERVPPSLLGEHPNAVVQRLTDAARATTRMLAPETPFVSAADWEATRAELAEAFADVVAAEHDAYMEEEEARRSEQENVPPAPALSPLVVAGRQTFTNLRRGTKFGTVRAANAKLAQGVAATLPPPWNGPATRLGLEAFLPTLLLGAGKVLRRKGFEVAAVEVEDLAGLGQMAAVGSILDVAGPGLVYLAAHVKKLAEETGSTELAAQLTADVLVEAAADLVQEASQTADVEVK